MRQKIGHDHPFGQKNLDYASQAPLHPGYTGFGPNDDHGQKIAVSPEGDVFPCPEVCVPVFKNDLSYGNVTKKNISALWDSRSHQEKFLAFNPRNHKCSCCPVDWDFNKLCAQYWPPTLG